MFLLNHHVLYLLSHPHPHLEWRNLLPPPMPSFNSTSRSLSFLSAWDLHYVFAILWGQRIIGYYQPGCRTYFRSYSSIVGFIFPSVREVLFFPFTEVFPSCNNSTNRFFQPIKISSRRFFNAN